MRPLTQQDKQKLDELNAVVSQAISDRKRWLDSKMSEYAEVQVGDELYDLNKGKLLGVVSELYRYWQDRDEGVRDTSLSIDYLFQSHGMPNCYDNTSRMGYVRVGTKQQLLEKLRRDTKTLEEK